MIIFVFAGKLSAQIFFEEYEKNDSVKIIVLIHPTVYNIKTYTWLVENGIIDIKGLVMVGVYYDKEAYDYIETKKYLEESGPGWFRLHKVSGDINRENIFKKNNLSNEFEDIFRKSDGIIFMGGADIPPAVYNDKTNLLTKNSDPYRNYFECSFLFHLLGGRQNQEYIPLLEERKDYPVWGICLGMQTMNVACGGTLWQDIPSELYNIKYAEDILSGNSNQMHLNYNRNLPCDSVLMGGILHQISFSKGNFIKKTGHKQKFTPYVYSYHHQSIQYMGAGLEIEASSTDGKVVEVITHKEYKNVLGFQFHPEINELYNENLKISFSCEQERIVLKEYLKEKQNQDFNKSVWTYFSSLFKQ